MSRFGDILDEIARTPAPGGPLPYRLHAPPAEVSHEDKQGVDRWTLRVAPDRDGLRRQRAPIAGAGVAVEQYFRAGDGARGPLLPRQPVFWYRQTTRVAQRLRCTACGASPEWLVGQPDECLACALLKVTPRIQSPQIGRAETVAELHDLLDGGSFPFLVLIGTEHLLARPSWNVENGALINSRALALRGVCTCIATAPGCDRLYLYRAAEGCSMSWQSEWLLPESPPEPVAERF